MKTLDEINEEIANVDKQVTSLEKAYEAEEDDRKGEVIWKRKERAEMRLDKLIDQADALREKDGDKEDKEETKEDKEDEDVCPICGSDLYEEDNGMLRCDSCEEYYERDD